MWASVTESNREERRKWFKSTQKLTSSNVRGQLVDSRIFLTFIADDCVVKHIHLTETHLCWAGYKK